MCKAEYSLERLYDITTFKKCRDLRRTILLNNLHTILRRKLLKKERKMAKNFEVRSAVPDEQIDTEDSLGLDDFFTQLKSVNSSQTSEE